MADIRESSRQFLESSLAKASPGAPQAGQVAQQIEEAVYDAHNGDTGNDYRGQLRTLSLDLGKNNTALAQQVLDGQVTVAQLIQLGPDEIRSSQRAHEDEQMQEQNLRESIGQQKIPVYDTDPEPGHPVTASDLAQEGEMGPQEASLGEEGDFKARGQPKIHGLEGIEFESGL